MKGKIYFAGALLIFSIVATFYPMHAEQIAQNAIVTLSWTDGKYSMSNATFTNANGYYEMKVAEGRVNLTAIYNKTGELIFVYNSTEDFYISGVEWKNITLSAFPEDNATINGHVYDNLTHSPIANANVSINFVGDYFYGFNYTQTDLNGYYSLCLPASNVTIIAYADGYYPKINFTAVLTSKTVDFYLDPLPEINAVVRGYVKDQTTSNLVEGATVLIYGANISYYNSTATGSDGYYEFYIPAGNFSIYADAENYFPAFLFFEINENETKWINISLFPHPPNEAWVDGFVIDNKTGSRIANANITVSGTIFAMDAGMMPDTYVRNALTDSNGYYNVSVPATHFPLQSSIVSSVIAEANSYFENSLSIQSQVLPGTTLSINISLDPIPPQNCTIKGYVYIGEAIHLPKTLYVGGAGAGNFTSIQDAIDAASNGDTIKVYPGVYDGPIVINKEIKLIGDPEIDGHGDIGIKIEANNTLVENFTIFNASYGIYVYNASFTLQNITIRNCTIYDCSYHGIYMRDCNEGRISNTYVANNANNGIFLSSSVNSTVEGNILNNNSCGIRIFNSSNNRISGNNVSNSSYRGIYIDSGIKNNITENKIWDCNVSIYIAHLNNTIYKNEIWNSRVGISISSSNITISENRIWNAEKGIYMENANNNTISDCIISNCSLHGIQLYYSDNNRIIHSTIADIVNATVSEYAIYLRNSKNNKIENNNLYLNDTFEGINLDYSDSNIVRNNTLFGKGNSIYGISIWSCSKNNEIANNSISDVISSIVLGYASNNSIKNNNISDTSYGIEFQAGECYNNTVENNEINARYGIYFRLHTGAKPNKENEILNNIIKAENGLYLTACENGTFTNNRIEAINYAIYISNSTNNSFINNSIGMTKFSFTYEGNIYIKNASSPAPPPPHWRSIGKFLEIDEINAGWLNLTIYYEDSDLSGLLEDTMKIWKWNGCWIEDGWNGSRFLDTAKNIVGVNITSFSIFAPLAMVPNHLPYATNPTPSNGSINVSTNATLSVIVYDEDGDIINVSFYNASSNSLIGSIESISSGNTATIIWHNLDYNTTYYWYVILNDGYGENRSDIWHFTTTKPKPFIVYVDDDFNASTPGWQYDRFNSIADAISSVAEGGIIYVYEGIYGESIEINKQVSMISLGNPANTIIKAMGENAVTILKPCLLDGFTIRDAYSDSKDAIGIWIEADGCKIRNVSIMNITSGMYAYGIYYSDVRNSEILYANISMINGSGRCGIYLKNGYNISLKNANISTKANGYGINAYNCSNILIEKCDVSEEFYGIIIDKCNYSAILNNTIHANKYGITLRNCYNISIENNLVFNSTFDGILSNYSNNSKISSNFIYNNSNSGVVISSGENNIVYRNYIYNNRWDGIEISDYASDTVATNNTISENEIYGNGEKGIILLGGKNNLVVNNTCYNNKWGIVLQNAENNIANNNTNYENFYYGFLIQSSTNNTIAYNRAYNNSAGITLSASQNNTISSNYLISNNYGIYINSSTNNTIYNNYFNDTINAYDNAFNIWNISKMPGRNIAGGAWLGGNYWHDYEGNDIDGDKIGDTMLPYNCGGNILYGGDWLPLIFVENIPPFANNDYYSTNEDVALNIATPGILGNDNDADNDTLTAFLVSSPSHGILTLNSNGSFIYIPSSNYYGSDSFTYKAYDGKDYSNEATVYININPINDAPIANDDFAITDEDTPILINLTANDYDIDGSINISSIKITLPPSHGNLTINGDGTVTYTPSLNYYGEDSFKYKVKDNEGAYSNEAWVNITINSVNDAPVVMNPQPADGSRGIEINPAVAVDVNDADGNQLTVTFYDAIDNSIIATKGNVLPPATVTITWSNLRYATTYSWYVKVSDGISTTTSPTWHFTTREKQKFTLAVYAQPSGGGHVALNPSGWVYDEGTVVTLQAIANEGYVFRYWSGDASGRNQTIQIIMDGNKSIVANFERINNPPSIEIIYPANGSSVNGSIIIQGKASDEDGNESLVKVEIRIDGQEWKVAEGVISWAYTIDTTKLSNGVHTIEARAYDGKDYSNIASITVNVQNEKEERIPWMIIGITVAIVAIVAIAVYYLRRAKAK